MINKKKSGVDNMNKILFKFAIILEDDGLLKHYGPLFHRWLPNGFKDAINLNMGDPNYKLKVWFERRGFVRDGFIMFNYDKYEVDEKIIPKQGVLEGGPLFGLLEFKGLSEKELESVRQDRRDKDYLSLGKKVVNKIIFPRVSNFLNILRIVYGQYWIKELEMWDTKKESLDSYCNSIELYWSLDDGKNWHRFIPNDPSPIALKIELSDEKFKQFITNDDWDLIKNLVESNFEPTLAAECLIRSREFLIADNIRSSIIEGVTALEIAVEEFIRNRIKSSGYPNGFFDINIIRDIRTKVKNIAAIQGNISIDIIEKVMKIIEMRHRVVHDGWNPPKQSFSSIRIQLLGLYKFIIFLLGSPYLKFPFANPGNAINPAEYWDKK